MSEGDPPQAETQVDTKVEHRVDTEALFAAADQGTLWSFWAARVPGSGRG